MNKNIIKVAFVAAIVVLSGINVLNAQKDIELSDIGKENVEALSDNEIPGTTVTDCPYYCQRDSRYTCIIIFSDGTESITCEDFRKKQQ